MIVVIDIVIGLHHVTQSYVHVHVQCAHTQINDVCTCFMCTMYRYCIVHVPEARYLWCASTYMYMYISIHIYMNVCMVPC